MSNYNITTSNIENLLRKNFDFKYNEINNKLYYKTINELSHKEVKEYELNSILRYLKQSGEKKVQKKEVAEILNSNFTKSYNPFNEYFQSLQEWKEGDKDYIQELADTITVEDCEKINWNLWVKKWLVAVVACAIDDTLVNQTALIFTGKQGIGKTTWMKRLVPNILKEYYYGGSINLGNKDTEIQLSENLFINLDELENLNKKNISALKEVITKPSIKIRRPYGTSAENMARRASFMGSVNNKEFLSDNTGNRRFLCFETLQIDNNTPIQMDLVYAQALQLFKSGFTYWFNTAETIEINLHNCKYKEVTLEQEILERHFQPCEGNIKPDLELETENLLDLICQKSTIGKRLSPRLLGSELKRLNWPKRKTNGRRYWLLNEIK